MSSKHAFEKPRAIPLAELRPGQSGEVVTIRTNGGVGLRLKELGFVPGTTVRVRRAAPLRDPVEYELRNSRVCLRRSEAGFIGVLLLA